MGQSALSGSVARVSVPRPVRWSLARKVSAALVAILLSTLLLAGFFAYYKFESVYSSLVQSRYSFVVFTIKKRLEDSMNLGLSLRQIRQTQDVLEREKARAPRVIAIEVYDAHGEILFDTDRGAIGSRVPPVLLDSLKTGGAQPFGAEDEDALIVGLPLVNILGKVEGGVVLRYPAAYIEDSLGGLMGHLARSILEYLALFSALAVAGLYLMFGRVSRKLMTMEATLGAVIASGGTAVPDRPDDAFEEQFAEFAAKTRESLDHIQDAAEEVGRLDRLQ